MASWRFSVGNLVTRAFADPAAVAPALADSILPLADLGSGYPDEQGGLQWRSDGAYAIDFDLNLLASSSDRADAPTGWLDLVNLLSGTPGLSANPPDWGAYGARATALRLYRPVVQEIDVMPGETVTLSMGIYRPSGAAGATAVQVRVVDTWSGKGWDGSAWADGGILESQAVVDTWEDFTESITADVSRQERSVYYVIVEPVAASYDATSYVYASANGAAGIPVLYASPDLVALIGHNLPADATVTLDPQPAGTSLTITPAQPSVYTVGAAAQAVRTWRLSIQMPTGVQPRPVLGEVWIGSTRTLLGGSPVLPITVGEGDEGQARAEAVGGRQDVLGTGVPTRASIMLQFTFDDASYKQARDEVARLTRHGEEPLLLLTSDSFEGAGRVYHGRLGSEVAYSRISPGEDDALRSFTWEFEESPLAAA
jgi:hypothetical protein